MQQELNDTKRRMEDTNAAYMAKIQELNNQLSSKENLIQVKKFFFAKIKKNFAFVTIEKNCFFFQKNDIKNKGA